MRSWWVCVQHQPNNTSTITMMTMMLMIPGATLAQKQEITFFVLFFFLHFVCFIFSVEMQMAFEKCNLMCCSRSEFSFSNGNVFWYACHNVGWFDADGWMGVWCTMAARHGWVMGKSHGTQRASDLPEFLNIAQITRRIPRMLRQSQLNCSSPIFTFRKFSSG